MIIEQAQKDFDELIAKNDFTAAGHTSDTGIPVCHGVWKTSKSSWSTPLTENTKHILTGRMGKRHSR